MGNLSLTVGSDRYEGWKDVSVTRSIEQLSSTFRISYAEQWSADNKPLPIVGGDPVIVSLDRDVVLNGYVDDDEGSYDDSSHTVSITGRSRSGDLVDCAAIHKGSSWRNTGIKEIAEAVCKPFGISVSLDGYAGQPFPKFTIQEGETVHELLERASKMRALMVIDKPDGNILLTRVGSRKVKTVLERGVNIKGGQKRNSTRDRFSEYICKAQIPGNDKVNGKDTILTRSITDSRITRYRPTIIHAETEDTGKELEDRLKWERNRRDGGARSVTYTVQGWRDDDGDLWEPNTLVTVRDDFFRINNETLLLVSVQYNKGLSGTTATLELKRKEAFDLAELPPKKSKGLSEDLFS
ncbi:hypothetical protein KAR91_13315 [Candidatus Pacearchaeota archaeon]|nr:hypothetical protein [Candidatus Pacearchaeota archaeon]